MKKIITTILTVLVIFLLEIPFCYAAYKIPDTFAPSNAPFQSIAFNYDTDTIGTANVVLQTLAKALLYFAAPIAIAMLVFAGFTFITGGDSSEKQEQAKKHLQWTLIGLLAIILSYSIVRIAIFMILASAQQSAPPGA